MPALWSSRPAKGRRSQPGNGLPQEELRRELRVANHIGEVHALASLAEPRSGR